MAAAAATPAVIELSHTQATTCKGCGLPIDNGEKVVLFIAKKALCHEACKKGYVHALRRQGRSMLVLSGFESPRDDAERKKLMGFFGTTHGDAKALRGYRFIVMKHEEYGYAVQFSQDEGKKAERVIQWYAELNKGLSGVYVPSRSAADPRKFHAHLWCDGFFVLEVYGAVTPEATARLLRLRTHPIIKGDQKSQQQQQQQQHSVTRLEPAVPAAHPSLAYSAHVLRTGTRTFIFVRTRLHEDNANQYVPKSMWQSGDAIEQPWNDVMNMFAQRLADSLKVLSAASKETKGVTFRIIATRTRTQLYHGNRLGVNMQYIAKGSAAFCVKSSSGGDEEWAAALTVFHVSNGQGAWPIYTPTFDDKTMEVCTEVMPTPHDGVGAAAAAAAGAGAAASANKKN